MDIPHDKIIDDRALLLEKYNYWRNQLIERASALAQIEAEKMRDPGKMIPLQNGQKISITDLVEGQKNSVREARQFIRALQDMLDAEDDGTLENFWSDEVLAPGVKLTITDVIPPEHD